MMNSRSRGAGAVCPVEATFGSAKATAPRDTGSGVSTRIISVAADTVLEHPRRDAARVLSRSDRPLDGSAFDALQQRHLLEIEATIVKSLSLLQDMVKFRRARFSEGSHPPPARARRAIRQRRG
jgi:hypothetical protein